MPRGKEPSWPVQKLIFELLVRHGNRPLAIQNSLDVLIDNRGLKEDTPGIKQIKRIMEKLQEFELDVLAEFPPSVWKKRRDYDTIRNEMERLTGTTTRETTPEVVSESGLLSRLEVNKLEEFVLQRRRIFPPIRQLEGLYDLAVRLQLALSRLSAKDWVVWKFPGDPLLVSTPPASTDRHPAELRARLVKGELNVHLAVEEDKRFQLLLIQLKGLFQEFSKFEDWKLSLLPFVGNCQELCREIWHAAESEADMKLAQFDTGKAHLFNVPLFVYEFALDNYSQDKAPQLESIPYDSDRYKLAPAGHPEFLLTAGPLEKLTRCKDATVSLCKHYAHDRRIENIKHQEANVRKEAEPFLRALLEVTTLFKA